MKFFRKTPYSTAIIIAVLITFCFGMSDVAVAQSATTSYTYDALGRLVTVTYPNGSMVTYSYDAAGNRRSVTITGSTWGQFTWGSGIW